MLNKRTINLVFALFLFVGAKLIAQPILSTNYTACPNQSVIVTFTWNNVGNVVFSYTTPTGGTPIPLTGSLSPNVYTMMVSHSSTLAGCFTWTIVGSGTAGNNPITQSTTFNLCIVPPAPLSFTNSLNYFCPGQNATIAITQGYNQYNVTCLQNGFNGVFTNPIVNIPNISGAHSGTYNVTAIGTCTTTGVFQVTVAPNTPITVNSPSTVCKCQPFTVIATLPGGSNFVWYHPQAYALTSTTINCPTVSDAGKYIVYADYIFGTAVCTQSAQVYMDVVDTSPISATVSPANQICENNKINLNAGAGGAFAWAWSGPNGFVSTVASPVINPAKPINSGTYNVTAYFTNTTGVLTCSTVTSVAVNVITVNQPVLTMSNSICQGKTLTYTASANTMIYASINGPNNFATTQASGAIPNIQVNAAGVYYVTAYFGTGQYTCSSSSSVQLNVVPVNTVTVVPPLPVCIPDNGQLQSSAIGASQYLWSGPNGFVSQVANPTVFYPSVSASGVYVVTAYFNGGGITCTNSNSVSLTVNPRLTFSIEPFHRACYNTPLTLNGPAGASSYTWSSSNGFSAFQKDVTFASIQPNNSGTYTINVSLGPCVTSASTTIDILTPLAFQDSLRPKSRTICSGDTTYAQLFVNGGSQTYAYDWNPAIYLIGDQHGDKKTIVAADNVYYNVTVYDLACPNYTVITSFSVNVNQPPKPNFDIKTRGCVPLTQLYDPNTWKESFVTTLDFGGTNKYQFSDSASQKPITLSAPGTYSLLVYSKGKKEKGGCSGVYQFPYPITVDPKPESDIFWHPENPTTNDEITFSPGFRNGPITSRFWQFLGGEPTLIDTSMKTQLSKDTTSATYPIRKYSVVGKYPISLTSSTELGCADTVVRFLTIADDFRVYIPNTFTPNEDGINDVFQIKGSGLKGDGFTMEIKDRWGNTVFTTKDINAYWDGKVNGKDAEVGTYVCRVRVAGAKTEGRKEIVGMVNIVR